MRTRILGEQTLREGTTVGQIAKNGDTKPVVIIITIRKKVRRKLTPKKNLRENHVLTQGVKSFV